MQPVIVNHPFVQTRLTVLRDKRTGTDTFRRVLGEVSTFLVYEATRDMPVAECTVETPLEPVTAPCMPDPAPAVVSILRAGNGLLEGAAQVIPGVAVGFVGLERDEETHEPREYYGKLPDRMAERHVLVVDPMLATGGSAVAALDRIARETPLSITFVCLVAAPEGVARLREAHPDVRVVTASVDRELNASAYILPGLGDAGDRLYGT